MDNPRSGSTEEAEHYEVDFIESLVEYLRHCNYGSRAHTIVEVLVETGCFANSLQQLDLDHVDFQQGTISIQSSKTRAIQPQTYDVSLSGTCIDVLETYVARERIENKGDDAMALFTTGHGRISTATIRRSLKQAAEKAFQYHTTQNGTECPDKLREQAASLSLHDLRVYALTQLHE
ncbi:tyrosine-type recombinase/integrase [Natronomonas moolapensis]|uniref:tyrosine-type recombinase/integrase n=1 Tax=Natronomonas moolapensis TaxID=416273 RepID=UPI0009798C3A